LQNCPIFEQLKLEEALLRTSDEIFCIINSGSPRAIVMGISGKPEKLMNIESVKRENIPVIKRFSGGGTVIVDENTLFITFIFPKDLFKVPAFPEPILKWTANLYKEAWQIPNFHLSENDYCIQDRKCGGNAQYIRKDRWLHHTSFLWDYNSENMAHLLLPEKRPKYRLDRAHDAFLTKLKDQGLSRDVLIDRLKKSLNVKPLYISPNSAFKPHRQSTEFIEV
jgi:lipoate-protein ligase A